MKLQQLIMLQISFGCISCTVLPRWQYLSILGDIKYCCICDKDFSKDDIIQECYRKNKDDHTLLPFCSCQEQNIPQCSKSMTICNQEVNCPGNRVYQECEVPFLNNATLTCNDSLLWQPSFQCPKDIKLGVPQKLSADLMRVSIILVVIILLLSISIICIRFWKIVIGIISLNIHNSERNEETNESNYFLSDTSEYVSNHNINHKSRTNIFSLKIHNGERNKETNESHNFLSDTSEYVSNENTNTTDDQTDTLSNDNINHRSIANLCDHHPTLIIAIQESSSLRSIYEIAFPSIDDSGAFPSIDDSGAGNSTVSQFEIAYPSIEESDGDDFLILENNNCRSVSNPF